MRFKTVDQHTFFPVGVVLVASLVATVLLWPRELLPSASSLETARYFSPAYLDRADDFRSVQSLLGLAALATIVVGPVLAALVWPRRWLSDLGDRRAVPKAAGAAAALVVFVQLAALPWQAIAFTRSQRVGLAVQDFSDWFTDWALGVAITAIVAALIGAAVIRLVRRFGRRWWASLAGLAILIAFAWALLAPVLIDPIFASFEPAGKSQRTERIESLARRAGVDPGRVYVVDAAKRTTAANAYVTGIGPTRRVVLYDTLERGFDDRERDLVTAHELSHAKHQDILRGLLWFTIVAPFGAYGVATLAGALARRRGVDLRAPGGVVMVFAAAAIVIALCQPAANALSRRVEARADAFAIRITGDPEGAIALERRLTVRNVGRPAPPALLQLLLGTHPTPIERIGSAETVRRERSRSR
jgi:STE24 endopeptidase